MKERRQVMKKIGMVFGGIITIFAVVNIVWFFGVKTRYMHLTKKIDKVIQTEEKEQDDNGNSYEKIEDGYQYLVSETDYLGNTGFACVSKAEGLIVTSDKNGNVISDNGSWVSLYIWPKMFVGYTYGIDVENANANYQIEVDNQGNYIPNEDVDPENQEKLKEVLEENREEIDKLFTLAQEMWEVE